MNHDDQAFWDGLILAIAVGGLFWVWLAGGMA